MERLQIREISRQLAQTQHMSIGDAERFVTEMFSTICEGLKQDKQVIINGFGTFKMSVLKEKEIVTFTPDTEIARLVNAPFENFKTVEITVDLPDEEVSVDNADNVSKEAADATANAVAGDENPSVNQVAIPEEETPDVEEKVDALTEKVDALTEQMEKKRMTRKRWTIVSVVAVLIALIAFGGYSYNQHLKTQEELAEKERIAALKAAEIKHKQDSIDNIKKNVDAIDLTDEQKRLITGEGKKGVPEYPCTMTLERAKQLLPHAGYKIVGTQEVVEVEQGQSLTDIAATYGLQRGEFLIQYHNALESVKEGQKIRIPLLEHK
ncbi:MAG: HU family DNA-binding protein [Bacteroidaceae bacterium]|nr:HU family DNA-binding protein [Bacteroidaceae bacterium]